MSESRPGVKRSVLRDDGTMLPILLAAAAILVLTVMDALIKGLSTRVSTLDLVALRYACGLFWCLPALAWARPPVPSAAMLRANGVRAMLVLSSALFFFYALSTLPLVEAAVFSYLAPLIMALLGRLLLGEAVAPATGTAIALGFAGVVVIAAGKGLGVDGFGGSGLGVVAALAAAFTYALAMVLLRARTASDPVVSIVTVQHLFAAAAALPAAWVFGSPLAAFQADWPVMMAIGLLGTAGHLLFAQAFKRAPAARIGTMEYTGFVWAVGIGIIWFGEWPSVAALSGAALIISGSLLLLRKSAGPKPAVAMDGVRPGGEGI